MKVFNTFLTGTTTGIGGAGTQLISTNAKCEQGVQLYTPNNSGIVWIGNSPHMTVGSGLSSDGFPLYSGESLLLPLRDPNKIYVKSNVGGLSVNWILF